MAPPRAYQGVTRDRYGYFPEESGTPAPKRQRVVSNPFMARSTPRLGKFARRVARGRKRSAKGKRSLANQVATIAKIQKADHKVLKKSQEYADFKYDLTGNSPPAVRVWGSQALINPLGWAETLRRSNHTLTSGECKVLNMRVQLQINHPATTTQQLTWTFIFMSGKNDFTVEPREGIDYLYQGPGCPLLFNKTNLKIHKKFVVRTKARTAGDPISVSNPQRSFSMNIARWLRRTPTTASSAEHNWKRMTSADFNMQEQIWMMIYHDSSDSVQPTVIPTYSMYCTFAVSQM